MSVTFGFVQWRNSLLQIQKEREPILHMDLDFDSDGELYLVLINSGKTPAKDVSIKFVPNFKAAFRDELVNNINSFKHISHIGTVREIRVWMGPFRGFTHNLNQQNISSFSVTAEYKNLDGLKMEPTVMKIDLNSYDNVAYKKMNTNSGIVEAIQSVARAIKN